MDRAAWTARIVAEQDKRYLKFFQVCDTVERGNRTSWALNLMEKFLEARVSSSVATAADAVLQPLPRAMQRKGLRMLRLMMASDAALAEDLSLMPLHLRKEEADVIRRQSKLVKDDAMPRSVKHPWMEDLFRDIMKTKKSKWKTSATARQETSMLHKFLRSVGWQDLPLTTLEEFKAHVENNVTEDAVIGCCKDFLTKFCANESSRRRYYHIFKLLFVVYLRRVDCGKFDSIVDDATPEFETLKDLDNALSDVSGTDARGRRPGERKYFTQEEVDRLRSSQVRVMDRLIVCLLETTGLRRRGVLNIIIKDVAVRDADTGLYTVSAVGITLTKGRKTHSFKIFPSAATQIATWLNKPPAEGGRPPSPSPFLFPSSRTDDGQMSVSTLTRLFKACCRRAGFGGTVRSHLHAMRHYHLQRLKELGNEDSLIQAQAGHEDPKTLKTYIDRSASTRNLTTPSAWENTLTEPPPVMDRKRKTEVLTATQSQQPPTKLHRKNNFAGLVEVLRESRHRLERSVPQTMLVPPS